MKRIYAATTLLIILLLVGAVQMTAQQEIFSKVFLYDEESVTSYGTAKHADGNFYICGTKDQKPMVLSMSPEGSVLWCKTYGSSYGSFEAITATADSCLIAAGNVYNELLLVAKITSSGDTVWTTTLNFQDESFYDISLDKTSDHGVVISVYVYLYPDPNPSFAIKLDSTGSVQWANSVSTGIPDENFYFSAIRQTEDGGYITTGINIISYPETDKVILTKLSPEGDVEWAKALTELPWPFYQIYDAVVLEDGFLFLGNRDLAIMKTDLAGNFMWGKQTNFSISRQSVWSNARPMLANTNDGGFVFRGAFGMMKTDSLGNYEWSDELFFYPTDILACSDGGFMAIGNGPVFGVKGDETSYPQIGIIKTDAEGIGSECVTSMNNIMTDATYSLNTIDMVAVPEEFNTATPDLTISDVDITTETGCVDFVGAVEEPQNNTIQMAVFPNPTGGVFRVDVSTDDALQFTHLEIYNQIGLLVFKTEDPAILNNGLDLTLQPEGIYYLNGVFGHKKAVARVVILR